MLRESASNSRALLIQLARLGDLVQSLPAIDALLTQHPERELDVLCAAPLTSLLAGHHAVHRVIPWDGAQWRTWADQWTQDPSETLHAARTYLAALSESEYGHVYNLNQHARSILMAQIFANRAMESGQEKLSGTGLGPWGQYLRQVANDRGDNRVHLADAWCGMCEVRPRGRAPFLQEKHIDLPDDMAPIGERHGLWVALVTGAGDSERCVAPAVWAQWICRFLRRVDEGQVVLIGSGHERETGQAILEAVPALLQGRVWDTTGRTTVAQLMRMLKTCRWTIGGDTGPLHLATVLGSRALGFYFSRARVHETGPYGEDHWVYQYSTQDQPDSWPIMESIELICDGRRHAAPGWTLWNSHMDRWGVFYDDGSGGQNVELQRAAVWRSLSPALYEPAAA
jgi:ADP-heptose:LPS heptosyltransferase